MISTNTIKLVYKGYMFYVRTINITLAKRDNVMLISLHRLSQEICANKEDVYTLLYIILLFDTKSLSLNITLKMGYLYL